MTAVSLTPAQRAILDQASAARDGGGSGVLVPSLDQRNYPRIGAPDRGAFEYGAEGLLYADGFE